MSSAISEWPTDLGEAPYVFSAAAVDPGLRLDDLRSLEDLAWREDVPAMVATGA